MCLPVLSVLFRVARFDVPSTYHIVQCLECTVLLLPGQRASCFATVFWIVAAPERMLTIKDRQEHSCVLERFGCYECNADVIAGFVVVHQCMQCLLDDLRLLQLMKYGAMLHGHTRWDGYVWLC